MIRQIRAMTSVEYLEKNPIDLKDMITETVPIVRYEPPAQMRRVGEA